MKVRLTLNTGRREDQESDSKLWKDCGKLHSKRISLLAPLTHRSQIVEDFCARTCRAVLGYIQTGQIYFAPSTTACLWGTRASLSVKPPGVTDENECFGSHWLRAQALRNEARDLNEEICHMKASPKSVYRLADKLGLDDLKQYAKTAYLAGLGSEVSWSYMIRDTSTLC